jgi:hypothetical protein
MMKGQLDSGKPLPEIRVPVRLFGQMNWILTEWGSGAVVAAGLTKKDQLREAIQILSPNPAQQRVYTCTGWRQVDGRWHYLTAGGAVGYDGFDVDLGPPLDRYRLPRTAENPAEAMKLSLSLLRVAPLTLTLPLWAGVYRAPLAGMYPLDFMLWLLGSSGTLKSSLAALFLSHYGKFDRTSLPGEWVTTANALEKRAFTLKDAMFVVDDYVPKADNRPELQAKAERLIRGQGNLAGRGRLRTDLTERPSYPPRGLIVSTGEELPPGLSGRARMLVVESKREQIDIALLTQLQGTAETLPHAMAGYVNWLAPQIPQLPALLRETFLGARDRAKLEGAHLRVPEILAQLWLGLQCALNYAEEIGACSRDEAEVYRDECWEALLVLGNDQVRLLEAARPPRRFLRMLLILVVQGKGLLLSKDSSPVGSVLPGSSLLGWLDEEYLYLLPEAAYQAVAHFCRDAGEPFATTFEALKSELKDEGLSVVEKGRRTITTWVSGHSHRVLQLKRALVEDLLGESFCSRSPASPVSPVLGGI